LAGVPPERAVAVERGKVFDSGLLSESATGGVESVDVPGPLVPVGGRVAAVSGPVVLVGSGGVAVGGTAVFVGGIAVSVGGTDVLVGGTGVSVGGIGVLVGGTEVFVGGTDVAMGGGVVAVGTGVLAIASPGLQPGPPPRGLSLAAPGTPQSEGVSLASATRVGRGLSLLEPSQALGEACWQLGAAREGLDGVEALTIRTTMIATSEATTSRDPALPANRTTSVSRQTV
jgi:hypothetical protein